MFSDIHHVSYLVPDLDEAINSYVQTLGAVVTGRGQLRTWAKSRSCGWGT